MGFKNFTNNKVGKSIVQNVLFVLFIKILETTIPFRVRSELLAATRPFAFLETKRELDRLNYFAKACGSVTWDREKIGQ